MKKRTRSLKKKVVAAVTTLVLCILTASLVIALILSMEVYKSTNELSLEQAALLGQQQVAEWFGDHEDTLMQIARTVELCEADDQFGISARVKQAGRDYPNLSQIYVGNENGDFFSSVSWVPPDDYDCRQRDWYINAKTNKGLTYLVPYVDATTGHLVISLSVPLTDSTGRDMGVLSIDILLDDLSATIEKETIMSTGRAFLLDSNGVFITHENPDFIIKDNNAIEPQQYFNGSGIQMGTNLSEKGLHLSKGRNWDGQKAYIGLAQIPSGWSYGFAVPMSNFNGAYITLIEGFIAIIIVMMIISFVVASVVTNRLVVPVNNFIRAAGDIAIGKVETDLHIHTGDELEELAKRFDKLAVSVSEQIAVMDSMAQGDFSGSITPKSEYDRLSKAINIVIKNLRELTGQVKSASEQVTQGSLQMEDSAHALAQAAVQQASSVEALSDFQNKVLVETRDNAVLIQKANEAFAQVRSQTVEGTQSMDNMVQAVGEIESAASNITKVIKTIEDIAFQTNILALNAGVEAARAGAHGKGFAVVAEEVRRLAAKSAQAAKETKVLIATAADKAGSGVEIAEAAQAIFDEIANRMDDTLIMMNSIGDNTNRRVEEITRISNTVQEISSVVQRNSSIAEQAAATSQEMSTQAQALNQLISGLRTGREDAQRIPKPVKEVQQDNPYFPALDFSGDKY